MKGDDSKKPLECHYRHNSKTGLLDAKCPHLKEIGDGMLGETYVCKVCGEYFFLDYDEMR